MPRKHAVSPHFVIVGMQETPGRVRLMSLSDVYDVELEEKGDRDDIHQWGTPTVARSILRESEVVFTARAQPGRMHQVVAECYPLAWERLLDLWVPPDFSDKTRSQIGTHFTFNPPAPPPKPPEWITHSRGSGSGGSGGSAGPLTFFHGGQP
jgi:hypothetical protein